MNRRQFFRWFRQAPVALPVMAGAAMAGGGVSLDGASLSLGGEKVMERLPDGVISFGATGSLKLMPPGYEYVMKVEPGH